MESLFRTVLDMSLVGSYCILLVLLVRLVLCRAPRWCAYALWTIVFLRLICPVFPESGLSLVPERLTLAPAAGVVTTPNTEKEMDPAEVVGMQQVLQEILATRDEMGTSDDADTIPSEPDMEEPLPELIPMEGNLSDTDMGEPDPVLSANEEENAASGRASRRTLVPLLWLAGVLVLAGYHTASYWKLKLRVRGALQREPGVREVQGEHLSFVMGIWKPQIYLSAGLTEETRRVVLCHERVHLRRRDYLTKPLALAVCCIHWFNPLVWLAFFLMNRDCEMSCDESVVRQLGEESKKIYSYALLDEATRGESRKYRRGSVCALLSFGEDSVKSRISHVLRYKKVSLWISAAAVILLVVLLIGLGSNPAKDEAGDDLAAEQTGEQAEGEKVSNEQSSSEGFVDDPSLLPLSFLAAEFCNEDGYCFDGMPLGYSYEEFYKRYAKAGFLDSMSWREQPAGVSLWPRWNSGGWVSRETGVAAGETILQMVERQEKLGEGTVNISGYYHFYNEGLMGAEYMYTFDTGEEARAFGTELIAKLEPYHDELAEQKAEAGYLGYELGTQETDEDHIQAHFVDENGVYIWVSMSAYDRGGSVNVGFRENLNYFLAGSKAQSRYFDFDQSSPDAVTVGKGEFTMNGRNYVLELQLQDATQEVSRVPSPWSGYVWNGEGQLILREAETGEVKDACKLTEWSETLQFQKEFTINFCDYNGDGTLEFLIGQYAGANYNVYRMYEVSGVLALGSCKELGEMMITSDEMSPVLDYSEDGVVYYNYYDNAQGREVEQEAKVPWYSFADAIQGEEFSDNSPYGMEVGDVYEVPMGKDAVMYVQNLTVALRAAACTMQYIPYTGDLEQQYRFQEGGDGSFRLSLEEVPQGQRTYRYWSEDGTVFELTHFWVEKIVRLSYQQADWDYVGYMKRIQSPDLFVEDGSMDAAHDPDLEYFTGAFHWIDQDSAGIDRVEWITHLDERWPEGQPGAGMLYNEETVIENYRFAEDCRILRILGSAGWSDVSLEELARSMDGAGEKSYRWEIGLNEEGEIAWIMEGYQE